ncbi:MAG TPA: hypothetical protein VFI00_12735 [Kribbella sp.]|nr:hypothetical protein [Kribbella sp.]
MSAGKDEPVLHDLEVEVDADLELIAESGVDDADPGPPGEWQFDPVEAEEEEVELGSLRGAIEALEADQRSDPGSTVSSG